MSGDVTGDELIFGPAKTRMALRDDATLTNTLMRGEWHELETPLAASAGEVIVIDEAEMTISVGDRQSKIKP